MNDLRERIFWRYRLIWLVALTGLVLFLAGVTSQVFLGDEVHHYRFAKDSFLISGRAIFDQAYGTGTPPGFLYATDPAWPLGLAWIWRAVGRISFSLAQLYHTLFYMILIFSTYGLGKHLYGDREGQWAAILVATVPMMVSFGILFYTDLPGTALGTLSLWAILKRRYFFGGLVLGLALLTKRHVGFLLPAFGLFFLQIPRSSWGRLLWDGVRSFGTAGFLVLADLWWRHAHLYPQQGGPRPAPQFVPQLSEAAAQVSQTAKLILHERFSHPIDRWAKRVFEHIEYTNSLLLNPVDWLKYFGVVLLSMLGLYFFLRAWDRRDGVPWICLASFAVCFVLMFRLGTDVRYIMPVAPFLALLAAKVLTQKVSKALRIFLMLGCAGQLAATAGYVYSQRRPTPAIRQGFEYVKKSLPSDALVLYPETNFTELTGRPMIWTVGAAFRVFWASRKGATAILKNYGIDYILVKKTRVYDDRASAWRHIGGFPQSFLDRLPELSYVKGPVFENSELSLWKTHLPENSIESAS